MKQNKGHAKQPDLSIQDIILWLKKYGLFTGIAAAIALMIAVSVVVYMNNRQRAVEQAGAMLLDQAQLEIILNQYPDTPAAPIAMLALASGHYHSGDFEVAEKIYSDFISGNPDHTMRAVAELGVINCLAAKGLSSDAVSRFDDFVESHPDHFLLPQAVLGKADCLRQMGRLLDAKAVYEEFITEFPESVWVGPARASLTLVEQQLRLQSRQS